MNLELARSALFVIFASSLAFAEPLRVKSFHSQKTESTIEYCASVDLNLKADGFIVGEVDPKGVRRVSNSGAIAYVVEERRQAIDGFTWLAISHVQFTFDDPPTYVPVIGGEASNVEISVFGTAQENKAGFEARIANSTYRIGIYVWDGDKKRALLYCEPFSGAELIMGLQR